MSPVEIAIIVGVCLAVVGVVTSLLLSRRKDKKSSSNSSCIGCPHADICRAFNEQNKNKEKDKEDEM